MKPRLLVIGGTGLVGSNLIKHSMADYNLHATFNTGAMPSSISQTKIDLLNDDLSKVIREFNPDFVIHTVGHPSVDFCETNHETALKLHVSTTTDIAKVCKDINAKLIFLSTDAVFDGNNNGKYLESDVPNPINYYGQTKLFAEKVVIGVSRDNVVLRTSVIYGWHNRSRFTNWIIDSLTEQKIVDPYVDQFNTPTLVNDLVECILRIMKMNIAGLYHAVGSTCLNRYQFAIQIAKTFMLDTRLIKSVTSSEKKQIAPRPSRTCLDPSKLEHTINYKFRDVNEGLKIIYNESKRNPSRSFNYK
jgi:dTDP-4-dehydrorhamnose reductase